MLKTTKRYVITTNAINAFGFRVLTEGIDLSLYDNNSIMLWMHYRAVGNRKDEVLPLGNVREIEVDKAGVMTGRLYFDDKDAFAVSIYEKYENGTLSMLSLGTQPIDVSDDPANLLPGQSGPTVMKSLLKEISCCDIGANPEAYAVALYDASGNMINLTDQSLKELIPAKNLQTDMKLITLSAPAVLVLLKLAETATEAEAHAAIQNLVTLADNQKAEILKLTNEKTDAETKLSDQVKLAEKTKRETLVNTAKDARKITADEVPHFLKLAEADYASVETLLNGMTGAATVESQLTEQKGDKNAKRVAELVKLSFDELFTNGGLAELKKLDTAAYDAKKAEKYPKK